MYQLGQKLGERVLKITGSGYKKVYLATTVEDADYLAKGVLDVLDAKISNLGFSCFWNHRFAPGGIEDLMVAPIVKEYMEPVCDRIDYLIVPTEVISNDCVLRTNLTRLLEKINPVNIENIIIAAPILSEGAEEELRDEFEIDIFNKFQFIYFAEDNEREAEDNVVSGITAKLDKRLASVDQDAKNSVTPAIVKLRRDQYITANKAFKQPDAVELIREKLYARLDDQELPPEYVDSVYMPSWWQTVTEITPTNFIHLARSLAKNLRLDLDVQSILTLDVPFKFLYTRNYNHNQKFKTNERTEPEQITLASHLSSIVAEIVGTSIREPYIPIPNNPTQIREQILSKHSSIDLDSLVRYCWEHRLPIVHFDKFPEGTRKPDGSAANFGDHPVIIVNSTRKYSSWLLFIAAHELGHIVLGHVEDGILIDQELKSQSRDEEEKQANRFAVELLFGKIEPYDWDKQLDFPYLKRKTKDLSIRDCVAQGAVLLNYARQTNDWGKAIGILKQIESEHNAPTKINDFLKQYLDSQCLDVDVSDYLHRIEVLAA